MGSPDLSEESMTRVDAAPVRGPPPTMSTLSSTEINRLLLFSCSEVAPLSFSIARALVVPSVPPPSRLVHQNCHQLRIPQLWSSHPCPSPSRQASQRRPMLPAPNPSLALLLCRPPSRSELQVVSKTLPSVGDPPAGLIAQSVIDTCRRTHDSCILESRLLRIPTWRSRLMS